MPKPCVSVIGMPAILPVPNVGMHHVADVRRCRACFCEFGQRGRRVERHRRLARVEQLDALVELERVDVVVEVALLLQLLAASTSARSTSGRASRASPMKRLSASAGVSRFCVSALTRYHSPRKPSLTPPPMRDVALRLELVAGVEERVPRLRRAVRVEARLVEVAPCCTRCRSRRRRSRRGTACPCTTDERRRRRRLSTSRPETRPLSGVEVAEPDVLHVVDAVEQELDVRRTSPAAAAFVNCGMTLVGVHQRRRDLDAGAAALNFFDACRPSSVWMPTASCSPHHHIFSVDARCAADEPSAACAPSATASARASATALTPPAVS